MARPLIRRFHPSAYTPSEAYVRATQTPREVRQFGEAMVSWALFNFARDRDSPFGDLPEQFGFRPTRLQTGRAELPYTAALSDATELHVGRNGLWCLPANGDGVYLAGNQFAPMRIAAPADGSNDSDPIARVRRCASPLDWVLGWNHVAAGLRTLGEYETWVLRRGLALRARDERPKMARKTDVETRELPAALHALSEWASDGEHAMLTWIIADARARGVDPDLPGVCLR